MASIRIDDEGKSTVINFDNEIEFGKYLFLAMQSRSLNTEDWRDVVGVVDNWKIRIRTELSKCNKDELLNLIIDFITDAVAEQAKWES